MSDGCGHCFKCREGRGCIRAVSFAPSAMPSRNGGADVARINRTDKRWEKDMPAYRRLRHDGLQPPRIDDCAALESRAKDQFEIEMGKLVPDPVRDRVKEGLAITKELEVTASQLQKAPAGA